MSETAQQEGRRPYRRAKRYSVPLRIDITPDMRDAITVEADAAQTSLAETMRDAIARGLPLLRDARRKRSRSLTRTAAANAATEATA